MRVYMDEYASKLNKMVIDLYRIIHKSEEQIIKRSRRIDLTINEMHLIESIGKGGNPRSGNFQPRTVSSIAEDLGITLPSVTVAINKLLKKGYADKIKSESDGRVAHVILTRDGQKIDRLHRSFHEKMVQYIMRDLTSEEKKIMLNIVTKLNIFFNQQEAGV